MAGETQPRRSAHYVIPSFDRCSGYLIGGHGSPAGCGLRSAAPDALYASTVPIEVPVQYECSTTYSASAVYPCSTSIIPVTTSTVIRSCAKC